MRFEQQISACLRIAAAAVVAAGLSTSGRGVFASEQVVAPQPAARPAQPTGPQLQVTADQAVKMAVENNLGLEAARLSPEVQALALAQTRTAYTPRLFSNSTKNSNSNPPSNIFSGTDFVTTQGLRSSAGVDHQLRWGGGRYSASLDGGRNTTSDETDPFKSRLSSNFNFSYTQPLLRNFTIDATRQQLQLGLKQQEIVNTQLEQQITQTSRQARLAYFDLVGAIAQLEVARESLALSEELLRNNRTRLEVGVMAPIDITEAEAEVASREESVITAEARIKTAEDRLRTLIMDPAQPDFWTVAIVPADQPTLTPQAIDAEAAVRNALANRTDLIQARKQLEQTDIGIRYARNQRLPDVNAIVNYGLVGVGGTRTIYEINDAGVPVATDKTAQRSFSEALRDIWGNEFKTWSLRFEVSYPIGQSQAEAALAQSRVQRQQDTTQLRQLEMTVVNQVREQARQVETSLLRVEATRKSRERMQQRYEAEQKRMSVGLSTTFQLFQTQRDLSIARQAEQNAVIAYNVALVNFEAVQKIPVQ